MIRLHILYRLTKNKKQNKFEINEYEKYIKTDTELRDSSMRQTTNN